MLKYVLKNSDVILNIDDSIKELKKSIKKTHGFKKHLINFLYHAIPISVFSYFFYKALSFSILGVITFIPCLFILLTPFFEKKRLDKLLKNKSVVFLNIFNSIYKNGEFYSNGYNFEIISLAIEEYISKLNQAEFDLIEGNTFMLKDVEVGDIIQYFDSPNIDLSKKDILKKIILENEELDDIQKFAYHDMIR
jgi:hypothetical protein